VDRDAFLLGADHTDNFHGHGYPLNPGRSVDVA
jgi:hypothetical protein